MTVKYYFKSNLTNVLTILPTSFWPMILPRKQKKLKLVLAGLIDQVAGFPKEKDSIFSSLTHNNKMVAGNNVATIAFRP